MQAPRRPSGVLHFGNETEVWLQGDRPPSATRSKAVYGTWVTRPGSRHPSESTVQTQGAGALGLSGHGPGPVHTGVSPDLLLLPEEDVSRRAPDPLPRALRPVSSRDPTFLSSLLLTNRRGTTEGRELGVPWDPQSLCPSRVKGKVYRDGGPLTTSHLSEDHRPRLKNLTSLRINR